MSYIKSKIFFGNGASPSFQGPRSAFAHEFPAQAEMMMGRSVEFQKERTGSLTSVARLEPGFVGGITVAIRRCTTWMSSSARDVWAGDTGIVRRRRLSHGRTVVLEGLSKTAQAVRFPFVLAHAFDSPDDLHDTDDVAVVDDNRGSKAARATAVGRDVWAEQQLINL